MRALVCHAPLDLRLDALDSGRPGPGELAVRVAYGGICGSDLHYYQHGGFGTVRIREPLVLGHEVAGVVDGSPVISHTLGLDQAVDAFRLAADKGQAMKVQIDFGEAG